MDRVKIGVVVYILSYLVSLGLLTFEVFRLFGIIDQDFVQVMLGNLATDNLIVYGAVLAAPVFFFLWFYTLAFRLAPPDAKKQMLLCIIPLAIFLLVGFFAIIALLYVAVTFVGIYMTAVGTGLGGFEDGKEKGGVLSVVTFIVAIAGLVLEMANQGWFDVLLPLGQSFGLPLPLQQSSPSPSGYGIGYYVSMVSILYSVYSTTRRASGLRGDILGSDSISENRSTLTMVLNPIFLVFWVLATVFLFPLLPFVFLYWGLMILYILGWITGRAGLTE